MIKTMLDFAIDLIVMLYEFAKILIYPAMAIAILFAFMCTVWYMIFTIRDKRKLPKRTVKKVKRPNMLYQILVLLPRQYVLDIFNKEPDFFDPHGIHIFCGEQGAGKTIACVEYITRLQKMYPDAKTTSNFGLASEDDELSKWQMMLDYNNGKKGVIVGVDEIQNWFMSGLNKLPVEMLEVVTQNRKNRRVIACTSQVFTRVNKGIREQVKLVYNPHTFLGCFTIVIIRKPEFDSEGNVTEMKYRGMYSFVHTPELREAYDTYKVIHTLAKEGFKDPVPVHETKVIIQGK